MKKSLIKGSAVKNATTKFLVNNFITFVLLIYSIFIGCKSEDLYDEIIQIDFSAPVRPVDDKIYGHFIENLDGGIYNGIWDDTPSVSVINRGMRVDVLEKIKELRPPVVRYPGGLFADGYHWMDGIGPPENRPVKENVYWSRFGWGGTDTNQFGTDEFLFFLNELAADAYINVNYATGTPDEAAHWVEYVNGSADTTYGRMRADNGHQLPYDVKIWGIGNETYGFWAFGYTDALSYANRYLSFADAMRAVDSSIKLVAVGYTKDWNEKVLSVAKDKVDYLSVHTYLPGAYYLISEFSENEYYSIVAAPYYFETILNDMITTIRQYETIEHPIKIAVDEWNVGWSMLDPDIGMGFTMREAIYTAGMLIVFQRMSDYVGMANYAQLVNVLGLIYTSESDIWVTPPFYIFKLFRAYAKNNYLKPDVTSGTFSTNRVGDIPDLNDIPYIEASVTVNDTNDDATVFLINRHIDKEIKVKIEINNKSFSKTFVHMIYGKDGGYSKEIAEKEWSKRLYGNSIIVNLKPASVTAIVLN